MSKPPPVDLKDWSKNMLRREVERLRAIVREHAERSGDDPREHATTGALIGGEDAHGKGNVLIDARSAVLLDSTGVALIDTKREEEIAMMLTLGGRVNMAGDRVEHAYMFGPDGAAGIATELIMLAHRAGNGDQAHAVTFFREFAADFDRRMKAAP